MIPENNILLLNSDYSVCCISHIFKTDNVVILSKGQILVFLFTNVSQHALSM